MKSDWLGCAILRAASLLAPAGERGEWLREWRSELYYVPRREAARFCLGAFRDALWLRLHGIGQGKFLEHPAGCVAMLAAIGVAASWIALQLPAPRTMTASARLTARDLPMGCAAMLLLSCGLLPATRLAMGSAPARRHGLRGAAYLTLKIALVQPIMFGAFVLLGRIGAVVPLAPLALCASWILAIRWVLVDQRRRCPVCLRLLTDPVRIGTPSETFLEWYGAESICARGHGMMHSPEISASYAGRQQWLNLDASWKGLFTR